MIALKNNIRSVKNRNLLISTSPLLADSQYGELICECNSCIRPPYLDEIGVGIKPLVVVLDDLSQHPGCARGSGRIGDEDLPVEV